MSKTPKLRFPEFSGEWEEKKLEKFLKESRIKGSNGKEAKKLTVKLWGKGIVPKKDIYDGSTETQYYIRKRGQLMYGKLDFLNCAFGIVPDYLDGYESTLDAPSFDISNIEPYFLLNKIIRKNFYKKNGDIANGSRKAKRIHVDTFLNMSIVVPHIEEQQKIANFFSLIDKKIQKQQEKVEAFKDYKKGMMQKIFSQEIRFKGENGEEYPEWEEKKLGEIITLMQSGLSRRLEDRDIGLPVIRSNNLIDGKINTDNIKYWYNVDDQGCKLENYFLKDGNLLVNFINSLAQIGKVAIYNDQLKRNTIFTTNIMRLNFNNNISVRYVYNYFQLKRYNNYIQSIAKPAVNQASFTTVDFKNFILKIPVLEEQEKIANFLSTIDKKLEKEQEKLDSLNEWKKGLLQQMFV